MERLGAEFKEMVNEAHVEHTEAKKALREMVGLSGDDPRLDAKMSALIVASDTTSKRRRSRCFPSSARPSLARSSRSSDGCCRRRIGQLRRRVPRPFACTRS
jgi:hypothetical protein